MAGIAEKRPSAARSNRSPQDAVRNWTAQLVGILAQELVADQQCGLKHAVSPVGGVFDIHHQLDGGLNVAALGADFGRPGDADGFLKLAVDLAQKG